ncbi:MAG: tRNA (adenosine(37)-N6)-threonylcarbamoyltransferase complex dimerization subunit type 1 TsaB [Alphaproteobacteria bacterium]|nr:tRNA (adenosine(37)-N6)-threonylcarbamoyltransferase complex dimerization subunit type 1 TsaB [Alphaproteobacteria bacterium]
MSRGLVLAIDTSFGPVSAALLAPDGRVMGHRRVGDAAGQQAEVLPPLVGEIFSACDASFSDLGRVVVSTGPGAFTGVRVGIAFAKGLHIATGAVLVGVSSLVCLAVQANADHPGVRAGVIVDARRGEAYLIVRDPDGSHAVEPMLLPVADAERLLVTACARPMLLVGSGRHLVNVPLAMLPAQEPDGIDAVQLGRHGSGLDPALHPVRPAYLRAPDARVPA